MALAPLWLAGIFGRGYWTPDEPREADIAWRMSQQDVKALPQLAGAPFLEKPPLTYWMAAAGVSLFGDSAAAARAPNLLYALMTALAIGALAAALGAAGLNAVFAALVAGSALLTFRVESWLAPDACLLAGNALALLGAWRGYRAPCGRAKAAGYALMHFGAAVGFMAKSAPGWLVPGLALLTLIAWERRFRELLRWELYAGLLLQALIIGPWLLAVAHTVRGGEALRTLFWNNIVGRFTHVAAPAALDYASGHRNSPGKYLLELPLYLLPWTLVLIAALVRAIGQSRGAAAAGTPWRFALAASLPFLALLSLAATARDVYAAPTVLGFALLAALWLAEAQRSASPLDQFCVAGTRVLVALLGCALLGALAALAWRGLAPAPACTGAALGVLLFTVPALIHSARAQRRGELRASLLRSYGAYAAAVCVSAIVLFPVIDGWQDLASVARRVRADTAHQPLALLDPDETTVAILDHGMRAPFTILSSGTDGAAAVKQWFHSRGSGARILVLLPAGADGIAANLGASGAAAIVQRYELPQGRRYALLGPPPAKAGVQD